MSREPSIFDRLRSEISLMSSFDEAAVTAVLRQAFEAGLTPPLLEVLKADLAAQLDLPKAVFDKFHHDVISTVDGGKVLRTTEDVATLIISAFEEETEVAPVFDEGALHAYCSEDKEAARAGVFEKVDAYVNGVLGGFAGLPVLQSAKKREAAFRRICERAETPGFFSGAQPMLVLRDRVLVFDERAGEVRTEEHSPEHRARFRVEADYEPAAAAPAFRAFLDRLFPACESSRRAFAQMLGCSLFGAMPRADKARTTLVLLGPPASGKSTAIAVARALHDPATVTNVEPHRWGDDKFLATLVNARLNVATELNRSQKIRPDVFKTVASWEPVTARQVYRAPITFVPRAVNLWACNELPRVAEENDSIERRYCVLETGTSLSAAEMRADIVADIQAELPGVINYLVEEFVQAQQEGRLVIPRGSRRQVVGMQYGDDPAQIVARCWLQGHPGARLNTRQLQGALRHESLQLALPAEQDVINGQMRKLSGIIAALYRAERIKVRGEPVYNGVCFQPGLGDL